MANTDKKVVHPRIICVGQPPEVVDNLRQTYETIADCQEVVLDERGTYYHGFPHEYSDYDVLIFDLARPNLQKSYSAEPIDVYKTRIDFVDLFEASKNPKFEIFFVSQRNEVEFDSDLCTEISNFGFLKWIGSDVRYGNEVRINNELPWLSDYDNAFYFHSCFYVHDTEYTRVLLYDREDSCVGFLQKTDNVLRVVLPEVKDAKVKVSLIDEIIREIGFVYASTVFPEQVNESWIENGFYPRKVTELIERKQRLRLEFEEELDALEQEIDISKDKYMFLLKLICGTGDELVYAVHRVLTDFGFDNLIVADETKQGNENREEDLLYLDEKNHNRLVIEVKGISGTPSDDDCSQVDKEVRKWLRVDKDNDSTGLFIVNSQKNINLKERKVNPFSDKQIKDAVSSQRGMMTTAFMYYLFISWKNGWLQKDYIKPCFFTDGYIKSLVPENKLVGEVEKYFPNNRVCGIKECKFGLSIGQSVLLESKTGFWCSTTVESIHVDGHSVDSISPGMQAAFIFASDDFPVKEGTKVYLAGGVE